jgi:hypothetical protein
MTPPNLAPAQAPDEAEAHTATILLVAIGEDVISVAVDPHQSYVYFATKDATFV